ncbi:MAG: flagellar type III secretion system pore protein FliP [Planctomycetota bacterium]
MPLVRCRTLLLLIAFSGGMILPVAANAQSTNTGAFQNAGSRLTIQLPSPERDATTAASTNQPVSIGEMPARQWPPLVDGDGEGVEQAGYEFETREPVTDGELVEFFADQADKLTSREGTGTTIKVALLLTALSLAPALILMTTSYVRVVVVLSLLRQAFGGQQLPPTQVLTALSLFITLLVMAPVWSDIKKEAIDPYTSSSQDVDWQTAWDRGIVPVRNFMVRQIQAANNENTVAMLYKYAPDATGQPPEGIEDVPLNVLLPAFMISELKVAFLLGFQIYLPFLIVDLVVSSVTVSMGMLMLPPTMVSFPLKLILFVMVDGWSLVVGMLLQSFAPYM